MSLVTQVSALATRIGQEIKTVRAEQTAATATRQPLDTDLTAIAGLDSATAGAIASDGAGWVKKTYAQFKTSLTLVKADVGLGNVDNTADVNKPVSTAQQAALDAKAPLASPVFTGNPTAPTPTAGDNDTSVATTAFVAAAVTTQHTADVGQFQAADGDLTAIAALDAATAGAIASDGAGWVKKTYAQFKTALALVKGDVGLGNVDNTSDVNKPVSTAQQTALNLKENTANKGVANGYASLDATAKVPAAQLPSYVDDVLEFANLAAFPATGSTGIIYVADDTNHTYRWSGSAYIDLTAAGAAGTTDNVPEGTTNLYYTQARTDTRINALLDAQMGDEAHDFVPDFTAALV